VKWNTEILWKKNNDEKGCQKGILFLCNSFLNFPKEVDGRGYHQYPQQGIEKSGTITADIPHDGLCVL
jgi:hypothetical protein